MATYREEVRNLLDLVERFNSADSVNQQHWHKSEDACLVSPLLVVLRAIAGESFVEHWLESGESDFDLLCRE